jgi:hypothetical protein
LSTKQANNLCQKFILSEVKFEQFEAEKARLRRDVKRILNRYSYSPRQINNTPDQQLLATENVLKQVELMADELSE